MLLQSELPPTEFEHFVALIKSSKSVDVINFKISEAAKEFKSESVNHSQITDSLSIAIQLSDVLSNGLRGNPRQCKRFLNTLYMRLSMAEYQGINLNRKILAKIMLLEYIKPSLFNEMAKMAFSNTLDKELKIAESAKSPEDLSEAQALKHWTADLWFFNWCSIDPPLAEFDLKPYFYFTRTSLDEKISRVSSILSPEALSILNKLASRAETNIDSAIRSSKKISDSEASLIHQSLFEKMLSSTEIDLGQFRAFLKYSSSKPLLSSDTMNCLSQLSGNQVPIPIVGELVAFANEHNMVENLREIADSWGKTNGRLKIALNAALNYGGIE